MNGMTWLMPSPTTADAGKSEQLPGAPSTDARAPAYAIMCCCPLGGSIPGAPNRASGEALGVGGRRRRPANAGRGVQLLTQPTGGEGFGILSSDAYSLQAAPPASCSSRCGSGLCFASVASVMKELTLLQTFDPAAGTLRRPSRDAAVLPPLAYAARGPRRAEQSRL